MSKMRYPKCPYCGTEYRGENYGEYALMELATKGWIDESIVICNGCKEKYKITLKLMYYGSKLKGLEMK